MNNKTWNCKPIQTWSSLHELSEIKKNFYKPTWLLINLMIELK